MQQSTTLSTVLCFDSHSLSACDLDFCIFYTFYFIHFIIPFGKFGLPYLGMRLQQPQEQRYPVQQVHAGSFCVSVIHQTLTWTTGSFTCVCDHSYACVYTRQLGTTPTACQHNSFYSEKLSHIFVVILMQAGFEPPIFGSQI